MQYISINGQQQKDIMVTDRGLAYGDGLFTTAKIIDGKVVLLDKHIERLQDGCKKLKLHLSSHVNLNEQLQQVSKGFSQAVLKVIITAGSGGRGYSRLGLDDDAANIIIMVSDFPSHYENMALKGISLANSNQQIGTSSMLAGIKHLNRLEQVLLRAELDERCEDDLIVTDNQGNVVEATSANVFYWLGEQLCTPEIVTAGVDGLIRQAIIVHNPNVKIRKTSLSDLNKAEGIFICNSLMGIMPVKTYNERQLSIDAAFALRKQMEELI